MSKKITKKKKKFNLKRARELVKELDQLGESIKENSYDTFYGVETESTEKQAIEDYIDMNTSFHGEVIEYNDKMNELCRLFAEEV